MLFEGKKPFYDYEWMEDAIMPSLWAGCSGVAAISLSSTKMDFILASCLACDDNSTVISQVCGLKSV